MKDQRPLEIEYKFLIRYPDVKVLQAQPEYKRQELLQMYLTLPDDASEGKSRRLRIRRVKTNEGIKYIRTAKEKITEMIRVEIEDEITHEEFLALSEHITQGYSPIEKVRHSFVLQGFTYEVDVFPFWDDRAYLEIEVESEDVKPPVPEFIHIIKDVTFDRRYRNSALSQEIITEPLD